MTQGTVTRAWLLTVALACEALAEEYRFYDLGTLGGANSVAYAVNDAGVVVGQSDTGTPAQWHAFAWASGIMTDLGALPVGAGSGAWDINNQGDLVGFSPNSNPALRWGDGGNWIPLDPGEEIGEGVAWGMNDEGTVVGTAEFTPYSHAFLWEDGNGNEESDPGELIDLGTLSGGLSTAQDINRSGIVVGNSRASGGDPARAFIYRHPGGPMCEIGALAGGEGDSVAHGINDADVVVGWSALNPTGTPFHAFAYSGYSQAVCSDGIWTDLGTIGGANSAAYDINDNDVVVGWSETITGERHAFRYSDGQMIDLQDTYFPDWQSSEAWGVNYNSWVVGYGVTPGGDTHAWLLIPEPAIPTVSEWGVVVMSLLLLLAGTVVIRARRAAMGGPPLQRWGTRMVPRFASPTAKAMGHPTINRRVT